MRDETQPASVPNSQTLGDGYRIPSDDTAPACDGPSMEWQKLDLAKASLVKKEVDTVLARLVELSSNWGDLDKSAMINTIQARIQELENFYLKNSDDERAILFEKERLRLRKALQPFYSSAAKDNRSLSASEALDRSVLESSVSRAGQDRLSVSQLSKGSRTQSVAKSNTSISRTLQVPSPNPPMMSAAGRSLKSPVSPGRIYAWEDGTGRPARDPIEITGTLFDPTSVTGFYVRRMHREEEEELLSDKFIDVQFVLTQEELTTLAARKKVEKRDKKFDKNIAAATSVHTSVPYVDPARIKQDMLRPGHPDRWLGGR